MDAHLGKNDRKTSEAGFESPRFHADVQAEFCGKPGIEREIHRRAPSGPSFAGVCCRDRWMSTEKRPLLLVLLPNRIKQHDSSFRIAFLGGIVLRFARRLM